MFLLLLLLHVGCVFARGNLLMPNGFFTDRVMERFALVIVRIHLR